MGQSVIRAMDTIGQKLSDVPAKELERELDKHRCQGRWPETPN